MYLTIWKSVELYNHEEWLILIIIIFGGKISNGPFKQKHTSILV